jgi:hypothetical protein
MVPTVPKKIDAVREQFCPLILLRYRDDEQCRVLAVVRHGRLYMMKFLSAVAATALVAAPVAAAPTNPAASLSVSKSVRASAPTAKGNKLAGGGILAALIAAGVVAIGVVAIVKDDNADSN